MEDELVLVRPSSASRSRESTSDSQNDGSSRAGAISRADETYIAQAYSAVEMRTFTEELPLRPAPSQTSCHRGLGQTMTRWVWRASRTRRRR
ncbi:hypothetical protein B0H19DRAFT_1365222, partial [Mycena capillaripes]